MSSSPAASETSQSANALLSIVAGEMSKLVTLTLELQEINPASHGGGRRAEDLKTYQSLDYVTQSLQALTSVCEEMAKNTPKEWTHLNLKSVENVTLAELKLALKSGQFAPNVPSSDGLVDLFDT